MERLQTRGRGARFLLMVLGVLMVVALSGVMGFWQEGKAFAADADALAAGSADEQSVSAARSGFSVSSTRLDLSPKVKKVPYGHKYIPRSKTVTVRLPDSSYYPVYWKSSNQKVATAKWAKSWKSREIKLTVYGHSRGKATITITNSATYETRKIYVTVRGYNSTDFRASKTKLDLSPKEKKVKGGVKYTARKSTVTIGVPDGARIYCNSSNPGVVGAEWAKKWNGNTIKLTITGHRRGSTTMTFTNSKTKKKIKIKVTVGGYGLGFKWGNPEKKGSYYLDNFTVLNNTKKTVTFDKKCAFSFWATNRNYAKEYQAWLNDDTDEFLEPEYYLFENESYNLRNLPIKVKNGKSKKVYMGDPQTRKEAYASLWDKAIFTVKIGKSYKTVYVDDCGMVTKVLNGRKIK